MEAKAAKPPQARKLTKAQRLKMKRENREPLAGRQLKLSADIPDGYVGRWFNDDGARIMDARRAGWEFIDNHTQEITTNSDDLGAHTRTRVGAKLTNEPLYAYLMVIEQELYGEDQKRKSEQIVDTEKQIVKGNAPGTDGKVDGDLVYVKEADLRKAPL